jgi:uncharacterized membrane protein YccC
MIRLKPAAWFRRILERESMRPDSGRALRAVFAVMVPSLLAAFGHLPLHLTFVALAAQSVAIVDVRGAYTLRLGLLLAMTAILTAAAGLGGLVAASFISALLAAALVAICGGVWRHLTPDYGASLAISSILLFLISVNLPPSPDAAEIHALGAFAGGMWGVLLQIAYWPIRPQHPLRRAVADSWVAVADLFEALAPADTAQRAERIHACEAALRTTLDHTYAALATGGAARQTPLRSRLDELNLAAARLATRVVALNTALESALAEPDSAWLADALRPLLTSLTNLSRGTAVTLVSHQPAHLAAFEVRLRRLTNLLQVFQSHTSARLGQPATAAQLREILQQIERHLPAVHESLRATIERANERAAFSLELLDLHTWTLRPLASALNLNRRVDPALVRFTARLALLLVLGVAVLKGWNLPHGYWLPLTMVIVLQPDYGSTRQRAAQRVLGTFAGSIAASALLWLRLPFAALSSATAVTIFCFAYFLKRRYAVAVFFITLFVVLLTEAHEPVTLWFTADRLGSTLVGGAVALVAALFFWPVWERDRLPAILAAALAANRDYLQFVARRFAQGGDYDAPAIAVKRRAESANSAVFSSLQRMMGDPRNRQDGLGQIAALANGNQRLTRAFTVLALHLKSGAALQLPRFENFAAVADAILGSIAAAIQAGTLFAERKILSDRLDAAAAAMTADTGNPVPDHRESILRAQCAVIATELGALLLSAEKLERPSAATPAPSATAPAAPA